jgi:pyruvate/2-oxoglutarate dehydrogenase complex dihydrolipoamide dehydrogenase (E3) component
LPFGKLCICSGVRPKIIANHPNIIGIRDLESVQYLIEKLQVARKVVVVGNGGIALEIIHEVSFFC